MTQATPRKVRSLVSPRMASDNRHGPIWNRIAGKVYDAAAPMSAMEAMETRGMLTPYETRPLFYGGADGAQIPTNKVAVIRNDQLISVVDQKFEIVQPRDIAEILDTAYGTQSSMTARWPVDTLGITPNNGGMFLTLRSSDYEVGGDQMQRYFLVTNGNDGGTALRVGIVHIRLRCWNTLTAAIRGALITLTIPHRKHANDNLNVYARLIADMEMAENQVSAAFNRMARVTITEEQARTVIDSTFALAPKPQSVVALERMHERGMSATADIERFELAAKNYDGKIVRSLALRNLAYDRYEAYNDENTQTAQTAWSVFNAVGEVLDNMAARGETDEALDDAAAQVLFGHRALARDVAFRAAYDLVGAR